MPFIFGASVIGPLHVQMDIPCQDACAFESFSYGLGVIAVADGLGSAVRSDLGSIVAVREVVQKVKSLIGTNDVDQLDIMDCAKTAVGSARESLERIATEEKCRLKDLACTLIVVVLRDSSIAVAHVGDGAVVARTGEGLRLISAPAESEYANEVTPLTSNEWQEAIRTARIASGVDTLAVFTDGCQRVAFLKSDLGLKPFDRFFDPVFSFAHEVEDLKAAEEEIRALLASKKISENSEDDKTLVLATLTRQK